MKNIGSCSYVFAGLTACACIVVVTSIAMHVQIYERRMIDDKKCKLSALQGRGDRGVAGGGV